MMMITMVVMRVLWVLWVTTKQARKKRALDAKGAEQKRLKGAQVSNGSPYSCTNGCGGGYMVLSSILPLVCTAFGDCGCDVWLCKQEEEIDWDSVDFDALFQKKKLEREQREQAAATGAPMPSVRCRDAYQEGRQSLMSLSDRSLAYYLASYSFGCCCPHRTSMYSVVAVYVTMGFAAAAAPLIEGVDDSDWGGLDLAAIEEQALRKANSAQAEVGAGSNL
jgi:hypothetical protein